MPEYVSGNELESEQPERPKWLESFFFKEAQQKLLLISQRGKEMFGGTFAEYCVPALH